jgi:hypothetical protein
MTMIYEYSYCVSEHFPSSCLYLKPPVLRRLDLSPSSETLGVLNKNRTWIMSLNAIIEYIMSLSSGSRAQINAYVDLTARR